MKISPVFFSRQSINSAQKTKTNPIKHKIEDLPQVNHSVILFRGNIDLQLRQKAINAMSNQQPVNNGGFKGVVYKLEHNGNTYAIKKGRFDNSDFSNEAQILKKIPSSLKNSQHLIDYFKNKDGKDILITTFVKGHKNVLKTQKDFDKFYEALLTLDSLGILHGDLNMANCLFDGENINIIDYGEGSFFSLGEKEGGFYPDFCLKTNANGLENNGIPDCIKAWANEGLDCRGQFVTYLMAKSKFYEKHSKLIQKFAPNSESADYEENLSKVLKDPSKNVIENEAKRIDILYTFEHADTSVNYNKNIDDSIRHWYMTLSKTKVALLNAVKIAQDENTPPDEKKYFEYQTKILGSMYSNFKQWSDGTFYWLERISNTPESYLNEQEKTLKHSIGKKTAYNPPDLEACIIKA